MQKANKTYKCNDLEVGSTLSQQLAEGYTISLQDFCLPEKLLETARRRCRHRTRNQSSATWCKYWIDYLRELYGLLGWGGAAFGGCTTFHHRLTATHGILSRRFSHLVCVTFLRCLF